MDGILPLTEAFLAFALTMLALATAVSSLVGICHRLTRWRAVGLRRLVDYFYRNEIRTSLSERSGVPSVISDTEDAYGRFARAKFIVDMTFLPEYTLFADLGRDAPVPM